MVALKCTNIGPKQNHIKDYNKKKIYNLSEILSDMKSKWNVKKNKTLQETGKGRYYRILLSRCLSTDIDDAPY